MNKAYKVLSTCKGGGYLYARTEPQHPSSNAMGLYPLHRVLAENKIGRALERGEVVHHIDGNKNNNSEENLEVLKNKDHARLHAKRTMVVDLNCDYCGCNFNLPSHAYKLRKSRNSSGQLFCTRKCVYQSQIKSSCSVI